MTLAETNTTRVSFDLPDLAALEAAAKSSLAATSEGVAARLRLARALTNAEPARAIVIATEAAGAAQALGLRSEAFRCRSTIGFAHLASSAIDTAREIAEKLSAEVETPLDRICVALLRGVIKHREGDLAASTDLALEALRIPNTDVHEYTPERAALYNLLGNLSAQFGDSGASVDHYQSALQVLLAVGHREAVALVTNNIGMALRESQQFDDALRFFDDALVSMAGLPEGLLHATIVGNAGLTLLEAGRPDQAHDPLIDVLKRMEALGVPRGIGSSNHNLGRLMLLRGELVRAEAYLQQARIHREALGEKLDLSDTKLQLVNLYRAMGDDKQAAALLVELLDGPDACQVLRVRAAALEARYLLLRAAGRFEEALDAHVAFHEASRAYVDDRANALDHERLRERERSAAFERLSLTDSLTGLPNRRFVETRLAGEVRRFGLRGESLCVAVLDVDHFKSINDRFSHGVGDKTLQTIASLLRDDIRPFDMAARLGGEEFLLAFPGNQLEQGVAACERLRLRLAAHDWSGCHADLRVTASFGVVEATGGATIEQLIQLADAALYRAKHNGRNRVESATR
jgi:diguanylate cyclase (GGDEF)-like protein